MDTRNPELQRIMHELETVQRQARTPGWPEGFETKTLSGPGVIVLGTSLDAGRESKQRRGEVEYISPERWADIMRKAKTAEVLGWAAELGI